MGGVGVHQMPAQVGLPVRQTFGSRVAFSVLKKAGDADVQRRQRRHSDLGEINLPVKLGRDLFQLRAGHLMVESFRVAAFDAGHRALGQRGFDAHHGLRLGCGGFGLVAQQFEHFLHVREVAFAQFHRFGIVLV